MKINKKINQKEIAGITLIALVITIIVLLILAGISISMLSGDNSILNQAGRARDITGQRDIEERIQIAYLGAIANGTGSFDRGKFVDELDNTFGAEKYTLSTDGSTVTIDGKDYDTGLPGKWSNAEKTAMTSNNITEVTGEDITNNNLKDTTKIKAVIKDEDNAQIPIPIDAEYIEGKESTGVVIKYKNSEFVWVPVPVTTENNLYVKGTTKPMARKTTGKDANNRDNYQGTLYGYSGTGNSTTSTENTTYVQGTTSYREPDILENTSYGDWSTNSSRGYALIKQYIDGMSEKSNTEIQTQWTKQVQEEYNAMIESVLKYGGFFVGRYETSYNGTVVASVSGVKPMSAETTSGETWYGMYQKQKDFTVSSDKMQANMIWGSQYDAMLNWAIEGEDKAHVTAKTYGNHQGSSVGAVECGSYNNGSDKINNIYDLEGNLFEWTQEAYYPYFRVYRGGNCSNSFSPSYRYITTPYYPNAYYGSRLSLYIK